MPHRFSGIPEVAGRSRSRFLEPLRRSDFPVSRKIPELLPLNAADLLCSRPLTKTEEKNTITSTPHADPLIPEEFLSLQSEPPLFKHANQTTSVDVFFRGRPPLRPLVRELLRFSREVA